MLWENIVWMFKYKEPCLYYFAYGLDLNGHNPNDYVGYSEFRMMRNILNIRMRENLMTLYTFNYLALARDKFVFYQYCKSFDIPHPKAITLLNQNNIDYFLQKNSHLDAFCKENTGESGIGAFTLKIDGKKLYINSKESDQEILKQKIGKGNFIVQERLQNHTLIDNIYPHSLNTLKLYTFLHDDNNVEYLGAIIRFGVGGSVVDNASQGGFFVGIKEDGVLMDFGMFEPGTKTNLIVNGSHPDTNVRFAGIKLPYWSEIVEMAKYFHKQGFYGIPSIGWDIAITNAGPSFTETGEDWEIPVPQCVYGGWRELFYRTHGKALKIKLRNFW